MNNVIILNKIFEGSWNDQEGNISHEIIDFALTDEGKYFVYNVPYGCCPDWIHITGDDIKETETHEAEYLYLTSESRNGVFDIKYRIKLKRKIHNYSYHKSEKLRKQVSEKMEKIYEEYNVFYGGKKISEILYTDTPLITFEADYMELAAESVSVNFSEYNFQRNKGYLKKDEHPNDYKYFQEIANNTKWIRSGLNPIINKSDVNGRYNKKTFLDLIMKSESEECYTNILYSILKQPGFFTLFCKNFAPDRKLDCSNSFQVFRERRVVGGRMDICAESVSQRVVIENKLFSGLNGIRKDETAQLSIYYEWGKKADMEPICFLVVPDFRVELSHSGRVSEIEQEILKYDPDMQGKYTVVSYSCISDFIKNHKNMFETSYEYYKYLDDIIDAFANYAYSSKTEYFQALFQQRINEL